jgi:hypothetical protein
MKKNLKKVKKRLDLYRFFVVALGMRNERITNKKGVLND